MVETFMLRRLKSQVEPDLLPYEEIVISLPLAPSQRKGYLHVLQEGRGLLKAGAAADGPKILNLYVHGHTEEEYCAGVRTAHRPADCGWWLPAASPSCCRCAATHTLPGERWRPPAPRSSSSTRPSWR